MNEPKAFINKGFEQLQEIECDLKSLSEKVNLFAINCMDNQELQFLSANEADRLSNMVTQCRVSAHYLKNLFAVLNKISQ